MSNHKEILKYIADHGYIKVVRCGDCINYDRDWIPIHGNGFYCPVIDRNMDEDGYCSFGENKWMI